MFISGYARYYPRVHFPFVPFRPFECSILDEYEVQRKVVARNRANERFRNWEERLERIEKLLTPPAEEEAEATASEESAEDSE